MAQVVDKVHLLASGMVNLLDASDNIIHSLPNSGVEILPFRQSITGGAARLRHDGRTFDIVAATLTRYQIESEPEEELDPALTVQELCELLATRFFVGSSASGGGGATPLFYAATLTQSLTLAPVANKVTSATITADITYARAATGVYTVTADAPTFTTGKTFVTLTNGGGFSAFYSYEFTSQTVITIRTFDGTTGLPADGVMNGASFKVEVYP